MEYISVFKVNQFNESIDTSFNKIDSVFYAATSEHTNIYRLTKLAGSK